MGLQIVWFKRDLRLEDHAALAAAAARGPVLPLVIVEPGYWRLPDTSARQWRFWRGSIESLAAAIAASGGCLQVECGEAVTVLRDLKARHGGFALWSHAETGNGWTYDRDRAVAAWCRAEGIAWQQLQTFGVWRGREIQQDGWRDHWAARWDRMMQAPCLPRPERIVWATPLPSSGSAGGRGPNSRTGLVPPLPTAADLGLAEDGLQRLQRPGRAAGLDLLASFLTRRGRTYTRDMSSPLTGETACSRLSPYLAYGALSMREVYQAAERRAADILVERPQDFALWARSIRSFTARLHWHCHFIQKLESEPEIEHLPFARIYQDMRPRPGNPSHLEAWSQGRTGYPFIDAAMRYLNAEGWINFRMRAMLMSFATYDLWLPWQEAGLVLARKFVDYEPGIHWSQCQMQSGETGINTVRIYSPVKQGHDQDPDGRFIRTHVPELAGIGGALVHEPWRLDRSACPAYPPPIVDHAQAARFAKDEIFGRRKRAEAATEADAVFQRHGSRATPMARRGARARAERRKDEPPADQLTLDL